MHIRAVRIVVAAGAVFGISLGPAVLSAHAIDWQTGYRSCAIGATVTTKGYGTQAQKHTHGSSVKEFSYLPDYHWRYQNFSKQYTSWRVDTYGLLDNSVTTGSCVS